MTTTSNNIENMQLLSNNLERLAAQRAIYSIAKRLMSIQLILSVPIIIILSAAAQYLKSSYFSAQFNQPMIDISWLVATTGILITLLDVICLSGAIIHFREKAAKIQELFDCDVLGLKWNSITIGRKPDYEDVIEYADKYSKVDTQLVALHNWYPVGIGDIPIKAARVLCQRSNIRWDIDLRNKVDICLYILTFVTFVILIMIGMAGELTINNFFVIVLSPCLPLFEFSFRYTQQNKRAIASLENLKAQIENIWKDAHNASLSYDNYDNISRKLQDAIFFNRKDNPLIFDWLYKHFQSDQEKAMNYSCRQMINEYIKNQSRQ